MRLVLPLRTWLVLSHLAVLLLPVMAFVGTGALAFDLIMQTKGDLTNQGALVAVLVQNELSHVREDTPQAGLVDIGDRLSPLLRQARESTLAGVRILDANGMVIATSGDQLGEDLSSHPEVHEALSGITGVAMRPRGPPSDPQPLSSPSRRADVRVFLATPIWLGQELVGVALLSRTPREEIQALYHMAPRLSWGLLSATLLTVALALWSSYLFSRSLRKLSLASRRVTTHEAEALSSIDAVRESHVREVGELASAVGSTTRALRTRLGYIGEFAGNVSHEFKTPLATLRGTVELLRDDSQMPEAQKQRFLANAEEELDRLDRMVTGLLQLARAEESRARDRVSLDGVIAAIAARFPEVQREGSAGEIEGDSAQIESALINLVDNALQHGEVATVRVLASREGGRAVVEVRDAGAGISAANLERIFDRFFTTDRAGGGTGLGLPLVRAVVRAHGGDVTVRSRPGETVFRLWFPAVG